MDCPFQLNADGLWQCPQCDDPHPIKLDEPPQRTCPKAAMSCDWQFVENTSQGPRFRCALCWETVVIETGDPATALTLMPNCHGKSASSPPTFRAKRRVRRYLGAVRRWIKAGRPKRSDAEVARIYQTLCRPCPHFSDGHCRTCGCRVTNRGSPLLNKIAMATEHCPIRLW